MKWIKKEVLVEMKSQWSDILTSPFSGTYLQSTPQTIPNPIPTSNDKGPVMIVNHNGSRTYQTNYEWFYLKCIKLEEKKYWYL